MNGLMIAYIIIGIVGIVAYLIIIKGVKLHE